MKQKTNISIQVQGSNESAAEFASRLVIDCEKLQKKYPNMNGSPLVIPTSASDGRMTALIEFMTNEDDGTEPVFHGYELRTAWKKYQEETFEKDRSAEHLFDYLIKLTKKEFTD